MNNRKSYYLIAFLLIAVTTGLVSCRGGGAKGAAAAAGAKIIHNVVEDLGEDESDGRAKNVSFHGGGYTGECKVDGCNCTGGERTATGKCSVCGHSRTDHRWKN